MTQRGIPYGSWPSVITTGHLVDGVRSLSYVDFVADRVYWVESSRLSCAGPDGIPVDVLPPHHAVGSALYGYGARPYAVRGDTVFFVDAEDRGLYRWEPGGEPARLTEPGSTVYGAPEPSPDGAYVYCVRERDLGADTVHDLVAVATDGSGRTRILARGHDFYGAPAVSPDGSRLAYVVWDHPHMAWDQSVLREIRLDATGVPVADHLVAGGPGVSVTQPRYGPDGRLYFVDDRTGWWNLYVRESAARSRNLQPMAAEFGRPDWHCGLRTYGFLADGSVVTAVRRLARDTVLRVRPDGTAETVPCGGDVVDSLATSASDMVVVAGSATRPPAVLRGAVGEDVVVLRESRPNPLGPEWTSVPRPVEFPTRDGETAHAFYYPPVNPDVTGPAGEPPPLIVSCHGGPTVVLTGMLDHQVQYWTSRGFAVVEVNYRGSPGFGRAYRERIRGRWGVLDVADCVDAARHLVSLGAADPARLAVRGKSSGGLTALLAAMSGLEFAAVTSYSGVSDPTAIPGNTHKVESHYLDGLVGAWPAERATYEERSPAHQAHTLRTPTLLFHGADDEVVPPQQSRRLSDLLASRGVLVCLVEYENEGHGVVRPENVRHTVATELRFLARVLGFEPAKHGR